MEEIAFMNERRIWTVVPLSECSGKPVSVRWVDTNKGENGDFVIRSRLVARDFKGGIKGEMTCLRKRHLLRLRGFS